MSDHKLPNKISEIPEGAIARIEITVMPKGMMAVNIAPYDVEQAAAIMCAALDLYGYEVTAHRRDDGMPSSSVSLIEASENVNISSWTPEVIAMG